MMEKHILDKLQAYHDGELRGRQVQRVEEHLAQCESCRAELDALQAFTSLLRQNPAADGLMQPERFVAQVGLQLPRRPEKTPVQQALRTGWRLIPVGLFGAWAFVQTVFIIATGVWMMQSLSVPGSLVSSIFPPISGTSLLSWIECFSEGDLLQTVLCLVERAGPLLGFALVNVLVLVGIALLYWSWLASWWIRQRQIGQRI